MTTVVALIHKAESAYGISFPDFPGVVSGGESLDEAFRRGQAALVAHLEALADEKEAIPTPRTFDAIKADPVLAEDFADALLVGAVTVDLPGKSVRINITLDERVLERVDRRARELGMNRSSYLVEAARKEMAA